MSALRIMSVIMRVLSLLFFLALLLGRHVMSDRATSNRAHDRVMMSKVSCNTADDSTFKTACLGGYDICSAYD
jgi:hypothetical protein